MSNFMESNYDDECSCHGAPVYTMGSPDPRRYGCGQCSKCYYCGRQIKGECFDDHYTKYHMEPYVPLTAEELQAVRAEARRQMRLEAGLNDLRETPAAARDREALERQHDEEVEQKEDLWDILGL